MKYPDLIFDELYEKYNDKPFDVKEFFTLSIVTFHRDMPQALLILQLNKYLTSNNYENIQYENTLEKVKTFIIQECKSNLSQEDRIKKMLSQTLMLCGLFSSLEFELKFELAEQRDKFNNEYMKMKKEIDKLEMITKIAMVSHVLNDELQKKDFNSELRTLMTNNKGMSRIVIKGVQHYADTIYKSFSIPKIRVYKFISDIFLYFRFISENQFVNFPDNLKKSVSRIDVEKIDRLFSLLLDRLKKHPNFYLRSQGH